LQLYLTQSSHFWWILPKLKLQKNPYLFKKKESCLSIYFYISSKQGKYLPFIFKIVKENIDKT
jgi:hypothetical protein